mmetsp:Transcript_55644/g.130384  ORF Transcript_55644/g.130384 Transcript_55644/m.130384 type:complete len:303 (+) Transcript_55644:117-1025(+)
MARVVSLQALRGRHELRQLGVVIIFLLQLLSCQGFSLSLRAHPTVQHALYQHTSFRGGQSAACRKQHAVRMEGTKVVYFGKEKVLAGPELYKYEFYQKKFDWHVQRGESKEAIEVIIAAESNIQVRPLRAMQLLASVFASFFLGSSDPLDPLAVRTPLVIGVGRLLRDHTLWHLTPPGKARTTIEKNIDEAETVLRDRWQQVEARHDLLEIQPYFVQQLNASVPSESPLPTDFDARVDALWAKLNPGSEGLTGEALKAVLEKEFGIVYERSDELEMLIRREAGVHPADKQGFQTMCREIIKA